MAQEVFVHSAFLGLSVILSLECDDSKSARQISERKVGFSNIIVLSDLASKWQFGGASKLASFSQLY